MLEINEALELALEAIDKETTTAKMKTNNNNNNNDNDDNNDTTHHEHTQTQMQTHTNANLNNQNETLNKTDEEKELKSKLQTEVLYQQQAEKVHKAEEEEEEEDTTTIITISTTTTTTDEEKISKEPIYENISAASMHELDAEAKIIPNNTNNNNQINNKLSKTNSSNLVEITNAFANTTTTTTSKILPTTSTKNETLSTTITTTTSSSLVMPIDQQQQLQQHHHQQQPPLNTLTTHSQLTIDEPEPYYQVPKSSEPYYDAPKHLRPIPVYENIEIFYNGMENATLATPHTNNNFKMEPPKEKPPPPPIESPPPFDCDDSSASLDNATDTWSSDNTYETISTRHLQNSGLVGGEHPSPPIKRMNSTKRIKKELRNKRSSFLGIEGSSLDDDESYLELTVAPPPDMAQLLQEERRLEKQLYMKAGLCDSSDTGESRDSGVSENHSRQSSEHYTNSSEENDRHIESPPHSLKSNEMIYQNDTLLTAAQTPLLQTVKGNSAESWTESATAAAAATKSLTEATATANAKMFCIEEKIREQEEVLRVERELLQLEQEELKRQRENLMLRENMARRELQHGAKMLMSANRRSLQDLNGVGLTIAGNGVSTGGGFQQAIQHPLAQQQQQLQQQQAHMPPQQIYANVPNLQQQYYQVETDYRKSMSDLNEFSKRLMLPPTPPTKPMRAMHIATNGHDEFAGRQRHSLNTQSYGGSLVKIATPAAAPRGQAYPGYHHQSAQNLTNLPNGGGASQVSATTSNGHAHAAAAAAAAAAIHHGNMTRNTLHALSATPKPKYTDGWVQVQNRKSFDTNLANDPAWLSAYQQKRKSMPDAYHAYNNHWLVQEAEQRRLAEQQQRRSMSSGNTPVHQQNGGGSGKTPTANGNGKPLPDSIIQTLTERVQSKGIGERKRFENYSNGNNIDKSPLHAASSYHHHQQQQQQHQHPQQPQPQIQSASNARHSSELNSQQSNTTTTNTTSAVLSVSGKKKCSHCGDELGRGAAMIIESLLLFYHINCFKCCVCHVQLGDGLNGTDVRVRNHKLHCQNCYSSDDGIKFSCV